MSIIALDLDEKTENLVDRLKTQLNVEDSAALIRRALAITELASETAGKERILTMIDSDNRPKKINLAA